MNNQKEDIEKAFDWSQIVCSQFTGILWHNSETNEYQHEGKIVLHTDARLIDYLKRQKGMEPINIFPASDEENNEKYEAANYFLRTSEELKVYEAQERVKLKTALSEQLRMWKDGIVKTDEGEIRIIDHVSNDDLAEGILNILKHFGK